MKINKSINNRFEFENMKLVIQQNGKANVENIEEYELKKVINNIKSNYDGYEQPLLPSEIFRFKIGNGVIIIYEDNKKLRTKNIWYEIKALGHLSRFYKTNFYHSYIIKMDLHQKIEIDGLDNEDKKIMVEVKYTQITQEWIDYYELKRKKLRMNICIIVAPLFTEELLIPKDIYCYWFNPDISGLYSYYFKKFSFPDWFKQRVPSRHLRILLNNGKWVGINRKLTKTAKHTPKSKLLLFLNFTNLKRKFPIKIYYSLSPMLMPVEEYYGKGRPLNRTLAAFDVDSDNHRHIINEEGYCFKCLKSSKFKVKIVKEILNDLGFKIKIIYSGFKGFHVYIINEERSIVEEMEIKDFENILKKITNKDKNLVDNVNFRAKNNTYDLHRIFKLPNSVDFSTNILLRENFKQLNVNENLIPLSL